MPHAKENVPDKGLAFAAGSLIYPFQSNINANRILWVLLYFLRKKFRSLSALELKVQIT